MNCDCKNNTITKLSKLQAQANLLKNLAITGATTTIVTIGIGNDISQKELKRLASAPGNSILLPKTDNLTLLHSIEQQLISTIFCKKFTNKYECSIDQELAPAAA